MPDTHSYMFHTESRLTAMVDSGRVEWGGKPEVGPWETLCCPEITQECVRLLAALEGGGLNGMSNLPTLQVFPSPSTAVNLASALNRRLKALLLGPGRTSCVPSQGRSPILKP
jgi:hypothetical protein